MNDRIELGRELLIDRGNRAVDCPRQVAVEGDGAGERLLDERLDELLSAVGLGLPGGGDDLLEQPRSLDRRGAGFGSDPGLGNGSALLLVEAELTGQGFQLVLIGQNLFEQPL
jgi:hypothetical protein